METQTLSQATEIQTFRYADIEHLLAEADPLTLYAKVIDLITQRTNADRGAFAVVRNGKAELGFCAVCHTPAERLSSDKLEAFIPQVLLDYVLNAGEVVVSQAQEDEVLSVFKLCQAFGIQSLYAASLQHQDVQLGLILLGSTDAGHFDDRLDQIRQLLPLVTLALYNTYTIAKQRENLLQTHEELRAQHEQIEQQAKALAEQSRDLMDSMLYASRIQKTLLPEPSQLLTHFADAALFYKPKDSLGGDFYWWDFRGHYATLVAADCTGHGIPGAMLSIMGINSLNQLISEIVADGEPDPARLLGLLNFRLSCTLQPDDSAYRILDGMDIAVAVINLNTRQLSYASAQFRGYLLRNGSLQELTYDRIPVAGQPTGAEEDILYRQYNTERIQLQAGDRLFLASDGFGDQFGSLDPEARKRKMGRRGLREQLEQSGSEPLSKLANTLRVQSDIWRNDQEQTDDILVLGVEV